MSEALRSGSTNHHLANRANIPAAKTMASTMPRTTSMVRRRSTVRFRNGTPAQRGFSNIGFHDQVTSQVMQVQLTAGAARRTHTPVPLYLAAIRLNATATDKSARHCQEKVRSRPLPVSVATRRAAADAEGRSALARSRRARRGDSRGRASDRKPARRQYPR